MTTLTQYWNAEVTRLETALSAEQATVATLGNALSAAQAVQRGAAEALRTHGSALAAVRKALAAIPMPADGDPLLGQMELSITALAAAQVALADADLGVQVLRADLARARQRAGTLSSELIAVQRVLAQAAQDAAMRAAMEDALTTGDLTNLAADAATATARVEGEFPTSATADENFLLRTRARRAVVAASASAAAVVHSAAFVSSHDALAESQGAFHTALQAVLALHQAAPALTADTATLSRLAALPAALPPACAGAVAESPAVNQASTKCRTCPESKGCTSSGRWPSRPYR